MCLAIASLVSNFNDHNNLPARAVFTTIHIYFCYEKCLGVS
jgi:hypothetical protein